MSAATRRRPIDSPFGGVLYFFGGKLGKCPGYGRTRRPSVKLENFCYNVAMKTLELLEREHHYKIPEDAKNKVVKDVIDQMDSLMES